MSEYRPRLILSVDVEDWPQSSWDRSLPIGDYCADNTRRLLELMADRGGSRATFFVLGKFAERHPDVVREIAAAGHEVASHGYGHDEIFHQDRDYFANDLARSTAILSDLLGSNPKGYRAPDFSVIYKTLWALDELAEQGYAYDSSIFPFDGGRYGIANWPTETVNVKLSGSRSIVEFPLTITLLRGKRRPVSGGGYARLMPGALVRYFLRNEANKRTIPPVYYCHPYELDAGEFRRVRLKIPLKVRLHQGLGRRGVATKLKRLLSSFTCVSFQQVLADAQQSQTFDLHAFL